MKTYSSLWNPVAFMYFWLNYCDENLASEIIKADRPHLFLLSDGTRIDDNEYLESLENGTELIVCTEEHLSSVKHGLFYITPDCFLMYVEAVINGTSLVLFKVFFNSLYI